MKRDSLNPQGAITSHLLALIKRVRDNMYGQGEKRPISYSTGRNENQNSHYRNWYIIS